MMSREIDTLNQYEHIEINLKSIMDSKGITRNALARSVNTRLR